MNIQFVVNDYLLAWNILFRPSISKEIQTLKERLWKNYSKEYLKLEKENVEILKYTNDFIPDDDTIYNFIINSEEFKLVKKQTDKYRRFLMRIWDSHQKVIQASLKDLLRFKVDNNYQILVIHPYFDNVEYLKKNPKKNIVWGKKEDTEDGLKAIMRILFTVVKYELSDYEVKSKEMVNAIADLLVTNEIYTRITGITKYREGIKKLKVLKKQLYPYWLMYQGADKEEMVSFMMRDQMPFDIDKYPVEKGLRKMDLKGFIDFCCDNQKRIIKLSEIDKA